MVDRVVADGEFLAVSGWAIGGQDLTFTVASSDGVSMFPSLTFFPRDDVAAGYGILGDLVKGFLATWRNRPRGEMQVRLNADDREPLRIDLRVPEQSRAAEVAQFVTEKLSLARFLFEGLVHNPAAISLLVNHRRSRRPRSIGRGDILKPPEALKELAELVVGWTVGEPDVNFRLVDDRGAVVSLSGAARWTRNTSSRR